MSEKGKAIAKIVALALALIGGATGLIWGWNAKDVVCGSPAAVTAPAPLATYPAKQ